MLRRVEFGFGHARVHGARIFKPSRSGIYKRRV
jgi:hypothetical protein